MMKLEPCGETLNTSLRRAPQGIAGHSSLTWRLPFGVTGGLTLLLLGIVITNEALAQRHQLVQRFGDSAIQGFSSHMNDSGIQRFDSRVRNSMVQRFESRMLRSPVQDFNSQMLNSAIQGFQSQMMYSPAQRVGGPWKSFGDLTSSFFSSPGAVEESIQEQGILPEKPSRATAPSLFLSLRCGLFTEMTIGESEILSEKEEVPCHNEAQDQ